MRDKKWSDGDESYSLIEIDGQTFLTINSKIPEESVGFLSINNPKGKSSSRGSTQ